MKSHVSEGNFLMSFSIELRMRRIFIMNIAMIRSLNLNSPKLTVMEMLMTALLAHKGPKEFRILAISRYFSS